MSAAQSQAELIWAADSNAAYHQLRQGQPGIQVAMKISIDNPQFNSKVKFVDK